MRLSLTACQPMFEELLLVLQPLSLLTFNLDLLFQHHHLEPDSHRPEIPSPPFHDAGFEPSATKQSKSKVTSSRYFESLSEVDFGSSERKAAKDVNPKNAAANTEAAPIKASVTLGETSPQLLWVQEKEIEALPPPDVENDSFSQQAGQVAIPVHLPSLYNYSDCVTSLCWGPFLIIGDPAGMGCCDAVGRPTEPEPSWDEFCSEERGDEDRPARFQGSDRKWLHSSQWCCSGSLGTGPAVWSL